MWNVPTPLFVLFLDFWGIGCGSCRAGMHPAWHAGWEDGKVINPDYHFYLDEPQFKKALEE